MCGLQWVRSLRLARLSVASHWGRALSANRRRRPLPSDRLELAMSGTAPPGT